MVRRRRRNRTLVVLLLLLVAGAVGYVVGGPLVRTLCASSSSDFAAPLGEQIHFRLFELLIFVWLFMFGASIGSFLNVVIYRTPLGFSLLGSSRCPYCRVGIRPRDNIPVFGWLMLRGRCRVCRLPISARYPLVEFTVGVLILVLGTLEVLQAGANLPAAFGDVGRASGISWLIHHPNWDVILACLLHGVLLCIVLSWALIEYDGHAVPAGYLVLALVLTAAIPLARPAVQAVPWIAELPAPLRQPAWLGERFSILVGLGAGLAVGATLSGIEWWIGRRSRHPAAQFRGRSLALGMVGIALGWQAVLSVALIAALTSLLGARLAAPRITKRGGSILLAVFLAAAVQVCCWGVLERFAWWPNSQAGAVTMIVTAVGVVLLACLASLQEEALDNRSHLATSPPTPPRREDA